MQEEWPVVAEGRVSKQPALRAMTIRIRQQGYQSLKELADSSGVSISALAAEAVAQFARTIQRHEAIRRIKALQEEMRKAGGDGTDSVRLIREAREERLERLVPSNPPRR